MSLQVACVSTVALLFSVLLFFGRITLTDVGNNPVEAVLADSFFWSVAWFIVFIVGWIVQAGSNRAYVVRPVGRRAW